jgi:Protein of unknown function (DUF2474)
MNVAPGRLRWFISIYAASVVALALVTLMIKMVLRLLT